MTTILLGRPRDGKFQRRCDARCYNAKGHKCTCICGGKNHGAGKKKALENAFSDHEWESFNQVDFDILPIPIQLVIF